MENSIYTSYINEYSEKAKKQDRKCLYISFVKFTSLLIFLYSIIRVAFIARTQIDFVLVLVSLLTTIILFWFHSAQYEQLQYYKSVVEINTRYEQRIKQEYDTFEEGNEYVDYEHAYSYDLDLFGKDSLYQYCNVAHTKAGKEKFVDDLCHANYSVEEIKKRQVAIDELSELHMYSFEFELYASKIIMQNNENFVDSLKEMKLPRISNAFYKLRFLPVVSMLVLILASILQLQFLNVVGGILVVIQIILIAATNFMSNGLMEKSEYIDSYMKDYSLLFELVENTEFKSEILNTYKHKLMQDEMSAGKQLKKLDQIMQVINLRKNVVLLIVLDTFGMLDLWGNYLLHKWIEKNANVVGGWFVSIAELESLLSFACFNRVCEQASLPTINEERVFDAKDLAHPLIKRDNRVGNDFKFQKEITIVSGSNMSGKTTFLRTIGINLVLAQNGARVCASNLQTPIFNLITSMRIHDDLGEGISTFYQELRKIKEIVNVVEQDEQALFLIDEIFKGTNSSDRIDGSKKIIHRLFKKHGCGFLTTHDLAMCEYDDGTVVSNWHFEETVEGNEMSFDYHIKKGIATTTNGEFLMRMLSLID